MSMTATDFRALAATIAGARAMARDEYDEQHDYEVVRGVIEPDDEVDCAETRARCEGMEYLARIIADRIADHCATRNHLFDRDRFLMECGIEHASDGTTDVSAVV